MKEIFFRTMGEDHLIPHDILENRHIYDLKPVTHSDPCQWAPTSDIMENDDSVVLFIELPGLRQQDVKVRIHDRILTIMGERRYPDGFNEYRTVESRYGTFCRSFSMAETVETYGIEVSMNNGVLRIILPKSPTAKKRKIRIKSGF